MNAFSVAAARVEHSSLRNMLSMCVRAHGGRAVAAVIIAVVDASTK